MASLAFESNGKLFPISIVLIKKYMRHLLSLLTILYIGNLFAQETVSKAQIQSAEKMFALSFSDAK